MKDCKPVKTPIELNTKLTKPKKIDEGVMKMYPYQSLIGALMYLVVTTRPDIAFAVNFLSQFNSNYNVEHWKAAKRILRYLKGTSNYGLLYEKNNEELYSLVDADWGADLNDRRSYSGYAFIISGAAICWEARKQRTVALSSTESEYMAISEATKEALYLKAVLDDVSVTSKTIEIFNDNQSAQKLTESFRYHPRTKHIDIRYHFIRSNVNDGTIKIKYMPTEEMPADVLTKGLTTEKHVNCLRKLGMKY
ncbi:secreted RxLR effector protein 161-like [Teleopsis dalmanni]|uniref:secreted RxLR effector protein 161-like n=1 Tax=Teleopsis dalmanni TaxID=139649 RepID=UPI0018CCA8FB|nr:secreted RxLR effector protein 161-like [Teleopsis dalmanni]